MRLLIVLLAVLSAYAEEAHAFRFLDPRPAAALDRLLAAEPAPSVHPDVECRWLLTVATLADGARRYDVAEAAATRILARWPHLSWVWGNLACYQGKQGRFADALASTAMARRASRHDREMLDGIDAVWLWHLGRQDEARALRAARPVLRTVPDDAATITRMVCDAFFHAACDRDDDALRRTLEVLLAQRRIGHWRRFVATDVAFDRVRDAAWFIALVGRTAEGPPPATVFAPLPERPEARRLRDRPRPAEETAARVELAAGCAHLETGEWMLADQAADRALVLADLEEARIVKAFAAAARDDADEAMGILHAQLQRGVRAGWPMDVERLYGAGARVVQRLDQAARRGGARRPVALAGVLQARFVLAWSGFDDVLAMMDVAEQWAPELPDVMLLRGIAYGGKRDHTEAARAFTAALRLAPDHVQARLGLADAYLFQGLTTDAWQEFEALEASGAGFAGSELHRARFLAFAGRTAEAEAILTTALAAPTHDRELEHACRAMAVALVHAGRVAEAEPWLRHAQALQPGEQEYWNQAAVLRARLGHHQEAAEYARRHLDAHPDAGHATLTLATALAALGRRDEATSLAASALPPQRSSDLDRFQAHRAVYAATIGDEDGVRRELTAAMRGPGPAMRRRWYAHDPRLQAYRDRPWHAQLFGDGER